MPPELVVAASPDDLLRAFLHEFPAPRAARHLLVRAGRVSAAAAHFAAVHTWDGTTLATAASRTALAATLRRGRFARAVILANNSDGSGYAPVVRFCRRCCRQVDIVFADGRRCTWPVPRPPQPRLQYRATAPRIGLDCRAFAPRRAGLGDYTAQVVPRLLRLLPECDFFLWHLPQQQSLPRARHAHWLPCPEQRLVPDEEARFQRRVTAARLDLFHALGPFGQVAGSQRNVQTVYDLAMHRFPQWFHPVAIAAHRRFFTPGLRAADGLVAISETVAGELRATFPRLAAPIVAAPLAPTVTPARHAAAIRRRHALPVRYLLFLGTIEPRKNLAALLRALLPLWRSGRLRLPLVVVGRRGWLCDDTLRLLQQAGSHIFWPGYVPEADLPALLAGAHLLIYPSLYEGFGLPVANAFALGVPVITGTSAALAETAADAALTVDVTRPRALAQAVLALAGDARLRATLIRRGRRRARTWSWDRHAAAVAGLYHTLLSR